MCLYIDPFEHTRKGKKFQAKTARKDIRVLKVLRKKYKKKGYSAPFQSVFSYELGTSYKLNNPLEGTDFYGDHIVEWGFHAYQAENFRVTRAKSSLQQGGEIFIIDSSSGTRFGTRENKWPHIVEAVIPKGAKYFIGSNGDIVSNALRLGTKVYRLKDFKLNETTEIPA